MKGVYKVVALLIYISQLHAWTEGFGMGSSAGSSTSESSYNYDSSDDDYDNGYDDSYDDSDDSSYVDSDNYDNGATVPTTPDTTTPPAQTADLATAPTLAAKPMLASAQSTTPAVTAGKGLVLEFSNGTDATVKYFATAALTNGSEYRQKGTINPGTRNQLVQVGSTAGKLTQLKFFVKSTDASLGFWLRPKITANEFSFTIKESKGSLQNALNAAAKEFAQRAIVQ